MTPLQKVAMGLVVLFLTDSFGGWDALPNPVGWVLVVVGVIALRHRLPASDTLLGLALLAGLLSVPVWFPAVHDRLSDSGEWGVGVPQTAFCLLLSISLRTLCERAGERRARMFGLLRTAYVVALFGPVLLYGGGLTWLLVPLSVLTTVTSVALVYLTFAISRRPWALATEPAEEPVT